mgnify:FL=1
MRTWIFQGNPDDFPIYEYIKGCDEITWLVNKYEDKIKEGDEVYIWKGADKEKGSAGIIAKGIILCNPKLIETDLDGPYQWTYPRKLKEELRVRIKLIDKRLNPANRVSREEFEGDLDLMNHAIISGYQGINFKLKDVQVERLNELWN